jgi:hypothetical protein
VAAACVFCKQGLSGIGAEEHIFPRWLLSHLGIPRTEQMFQGTGSEATLDVDDDGGRVHGTWRFVEGRVCKACNNGWLQRLEQKTRAGLEILMKDAGRIVALDPSQRELLARWAAKTAFLVANVSPFKRGGVPPGVCVYAGRSGTRTKSAYIQSTNWPQIHSRRSGVLVGAMVGAYKIGLQIEDLLLLVAFTPQSGVTFATAAGVHVPLNPQHMVWPCYLADMPTKEQPPLWMFTRSLAAVIA